MILISTDTVVVGIGTKRDCQSLKYLLLNLCDKVIFLAWHQTKPMLNAVKTNLCER